jgi:hypothetical protein
MEDFLTNPTARREVITRRLAGHILEDLRCATVTPSQASWAAYDLQGPYRFGWMPPVQVEDDVPALLVAFCPELLTSTTMWLDDEQLDTYLTVIETFIDGFVAYFKEPTDMVYQRVQNQLYENCPEALALVTAVELRALDEGLVRKAPAVS